MRSSRDVSGGPAEQRAQPIPGSQIGKIGGLAENSATSDSRYLSAALVLIVGLMAAEVVVGLLASSLALISDAGHMLTDEAAITLALFATRLAAQPARGHLT